MDLGDLFKDLIWDNVVSAAIEKLIAAYPVLGWGPQGLFAKWLLTKAYDLAYDKLSDFIDFQATIFKNKLLEKEFRTASVKLKLVARDWGTESDAFRSARVENKKALSNLVRLAA